MIRILILVSMMLHSYSIIGQSILDKSGAITRSDMAEENIYLCFTGHDFLEGFHHVLDVLEQQNVKASFFLTGDFIRDNPDLVRNIAKKEHFIGGHSDKHLLYCDWSKRDSLLHTPVEIKADILNNLHALSELGIHPKYFMPPYEWYNKQVVEIAKDLNQVTVNFSSGTRSNADYTTPDMPNYIASKEILTSIYKYEELHGLNGFHLLIHPGTSPLRRDKLYLHLEDLITNFKNKGYQFSRFK